MKLARNSLWLLGPLLGQLLGQLLGPFYLSCMRAVGKKDFLLGSLVVVLLYYLIFSHLDFTCGSGFRCLLRFLVFC